MVECLRGDTYPRKKTTVHMHVIALILKSLIIGWTFFMLPRISRSAVALILARLAVRVAARVAQVELLQGMGPFSLRSGRRGRRALRRPDVFT